MLKPFFAIHKNAMPCRGDNVRRALGFTLIEVLISMIILAVGLLGLASLQALALKNNKDAYLVSQASLLAYEMGDRIKANGAYWGASPPPDLAALTPDIGNGCNDPNQTCTSAQMAAYDYAYWQNNVQNALPASTATISWTDITPPCTGTPPALCLILIWQRSDQSKLAGNSTYRLEITP